MSLSNSRNTLEVLNASYCLQYDIGYIVAYTVQ